jgi:aryl-alcohol dehydrogenase-like predicted oxidoreductase
MMQQLPLGRSGLDVSALGFGCGSVGGLMLRGTPAEQRRAVAAAIDAGVTYFDTAASYGDGKSEESLGRVLSQLGARPIVGTKFRVRAGDPDLSGQILSSFSRSRARLGRDIDLLQLHTEIGGTGVSPDLVPQIAEVVADLGREGRIRAAGLTGRGDTDALLDVVRSRVFDSVQVYVNIVNRSAANAGTAPRGEQDYGGLLRVAARAGLGVLAIRVLAGGAIPGTSKHPIAGERGSFPPGASFDDYVRRRTPFADAANQLGCEDVVELALRFVLALPGVSTAVVGFSDVAQLRDAVRYAERGPLSAEGMIRLAAIHPN